MLILEIGWNGVTPRHLNQQNNSSESKTDNFLEMQDRSISYLWSKQKKWAIAKTKHLKNPCGVAWNMISDKATKRTRNHRVTGHNMYIQIGFHSGTCLSFPPFLHVLQWLSQFPFMSIPYGWVVDILSVPEMSFFSKKHICYQSKFQEPYYLSHLEESKQQAHRGPTKTYVQEVPQLGVQ